MNNEKSWDNLWLFQFFFVPLQRETIKIDL